MKSVQSTQQEETHNQYRNRVGRISRHQHLMSQKIDHSMRRAEIKRFSEASDRIEKKVQREIEEISQSRSTFREKQIAHDAARGAYLNRSEKDAGEAIEVVIETVSSQVSRVQVAVG
jgi:hypothetical protein